MSDTVYRDRGDLDFHAGSSVSAVPNSVGRSDGSQAGDDVTSEVGRKRTAAMSEEGRRMKPAAGGKTVHLPAFDKTVDLAGMQVAATEQLSSFFGKIATTAKDFEEHYKRLAAEHDGLLREVEEGKAQRATELTVWKDEKEALQKWIYGLIKEVEEKEAENKRLEKARVEAAEEASSLKAQLQLNEQFVRMATTNSLRYNRMLGELKKEVTHVFDFHENNMRGKFPPVVREVWPQQEEVEAILMRSDQWTGLSKQQRTKFVDRGWEDLDNVCRRTRGNSQNSFEPYVSENGVVTGVNMNDPEMLRLQGQYGDEMVEYIYGIMVEVDRVNGSGRYPVRPLQNPVTRQPVPVVEAIHAVFDYLACRKPAFKAKHKVAHMPGRPDAQIIPDLMDVPPDE